MNIESISNQLLYTTVPIWVERENSMENSFGTGFIFNYKVKEGMFIPFIITNYHVVKNAKKIITEFVISIDNKPSNKDRVKVELVNIDSFNELIDISVIPIGPVLHKLSNTKINIFFKSIDENIILKQEEIEQLSAIEDIIFIGYPNGFYDTKNMLPIVRKGITATPIWNNFNDQDKFIIDAGVYPGSSGSPVFLFNQGFYTDGNSNTFFGGTRLKFLGILSESVVKLDNNALSYFLGLGSVINVKSIIEFLQSIVKQINIK